MSKQKSEKDRKKRLQRRKNQMEMEKKSFQKKQKQFLEQLIEMEKNKGSFNNLPTIDPINTNGPLF